MQADSGETSPRPFATAIASQKRIKKSGPRGRRPKQNWYERAPSLRGKRGGKTGPRALRPSLRLTRTPPRPSPTAASTSVGAEWKPSKRACWALREEVARPKPKSACSNGPASPGGPRPRTAAEVAVSQLWAHNSAWLACRSRIGEKVISSRQARSEAAPNWPRADLRKSVRLPGGRAQRPWTYGNSRRLKIDLERRPSRPCPALAEHPPPGSRTGQGGRVNANSRTPSAPTTKLLTRGRTPTDPLSGGALFTWLGLIQCAALELQPRGCPPSSTDSSFQLDGLPRPRTFIVASCGLSGGVRPFRSPSPDGAGTAGRTYMRVSVSPLQASRWTPTPAAAATNRSGSSRPWISLRRGPRLARTRVGRLANPSMLGLPRRPYLRTRRGAATVGPPMSLGAAPCTKPPETTEAE